MNSQHPSQPPQPTEAPRPSDPETMSLDALHRRRAMIRGLGKTTAVVAAAIPIKTLANGTMPPAGPPKLCTVSGVQSNLVSGRTGVNTNQCMGYHPEHFINRQTNPPTAANWPANPSVGGVPFGPGSTFAAVFGGGPNQTLIDSLAAGADEATWVAALLTAILQPANFQFPYSASQVRAYYNSPEPLKSNALSFFLSYLQNVM